MAGVATSQQGGRGHLAHHLVMLDQVLEHAREFDVIIFTPITFIFQSPVFACSSCYDVAWPARSRSGPGLRSLSRCTCYLNFEFPTGTSALGKLGGGHGLPPELFPFQPNPGNLFGFSWRISPEKRANLERSKSRSGQECHSKLPP